MSENINNNLPDDKNGVEPISNNNINTDFSTTIEKSPKKDNKKLLMIIAALIVIGAMIAAIGFLSNPKVKIAKALADVPTEFTNTLNDFAPEIAFGDIINTSYETGISDVQSKLTITGANLNGGKPITIDFITKNNPKAKKSAMNFNFDLGGVNFSTDMIAIGDEFYFNAPSLYSKPLKLNLKTLGQDLASSPAKADLENTGADVDENLSVDFYATPNSNKEFEYGFKKYAKAEIDTLTKNMKVEKVKVADTYSSDLTTLGMTAKEVTAYELTIKASDIKALLNKIVDYNAKVQQDKFDSLYDSFKSETDSQKEQINSMDLPETVTSTVLIEDKKLIGVIFNNEEENSDIKIYLAGKLNTTDKIAIIATDENEQSANVIEMQNTKDLKTINILSNEHAAADALKNVKPVNEITNTGDVITIKNVKNSKSYDINLSEIKTGKAFRAKFEQIPVEVDGYKLMDFSGEIFVGIESPEITAPENPQDLLKMDEKSYEKFKTELVDNSKKIGAQFMFKLTTGGNIPDEASSIGIIGGADGPTAIRIKK